MASQSTSIDFDTSDLIRLSVDMGKMPGKAVAGIEAVAAKAALNIKNGLAAEATGHPMFPQFASAISYDRKLAIGSVEYEIGPDKQRPAGALGNILYFGTSKNAPVLNLMGPLEAEEPNFIKYLELVAVKAIG